MKQARARGVLVTVLGIAALAAGLAASQQWIEVASDEGAISVMMPCVPPWKSEWVPRGNAPSGYRSHIALCKAADETYLVGWVDYEPGYAPNVQAELEANRDNFVNGMQAQLLTTTNTTWQGFPALEFTARRGDTHDITSRVVMKATRPYQLAVLTPAGQHRSANIDRFMASQRLK